MNKQYKITSYGIKRTTDINQRIELLNNALKVIEDFLIITKDNKLKKESNNKSNDNK